MNRNPYEPPRLDACAAEDGPPVRDGYFVSLASRLEWGELWRVCPSALVFLIFAVRKLLGLAGRPVLAFGSPELVLDPEFDRFPPEIAARLEAFLAVADSCGLKYVCLARTPMIGIVDAGGAVAAADDGRYLAMLAVHRLYQRTGVTEQAYFACYSQLRDGRCLVTSGNRPQLRFRPEYAVEHRPEATVREVFQRHDERLADFADQVVATPTRDEQLALVRTLDRQKIEFYVGRGVYVPADSRALDQCARNRVLVEAVASPGGRWFVRLLLMIVLLGYLYVLGTRYFDSATDWIVAVGVIGTVGLLAILAAARRGARLRRDQARLDEMFRPNT